MSDIFKSFWVSDDCQANSLGSQKWQFVFDVFFFLQVQVVLGDFFDEFQANISRFLKRKFISASDKFKLVCYFNFRRLLGLLERFSMCR